jgi:hypothetical protein
LSWTATTRQPPAAARPAPARRPARRRPALPVAAAAATVALALAGCGSSHPAGSSQDPATLVPATAALYAGADVRPEGEERTNALALGSSLTHQANPYLRLLAILRTPGAPQLDYSREIAPWLGPHAGIYLTSLSGAGALLPIIEEGLLGGSATASFPFGANAIQGALVLDTSDVSRARSFLEGAEHRARATQTSYRGVSYATTTGGTAFAIVDRLVAIGSEAGVHGVIDTSLGGPALTRSPGYSRLLADAPAGALAHLYTNPASGPAAAAASGGGAHVLELLAGAREANISLLPGAGSATLDLDSLQSATSASRPGLLTPGPEGATALGELPGNSWLAVGLGHLGMTLEADAAGVQEVAGLLGGLAGSSASGSGSSVVSLDSLIEGLITPLRILGSEDPAARADYTRWMGAGGVFASGLGLLEIKAAIAIESTDPALSRAAVGKLGAALHAAGDSVEQTSIPGTDAAIGVRVTGLPLIVYIADGKSSAGTTKFVIGLGEPSVTAVLDPSSTLAGSGLEASAKSTLGGSLEPSLLIEVPTLVGLLEALGLSEGPVFSKVLPALRAVTTVAGGRAELAGGVERFEIHAGLRPGG